MDLFEALARHALGDRGQIEPAFGPAAPERPAIDPVDEQSDAADLPWGEKRGASPPDFPAVEDELDGANRMFAPARADPAAGIEDLAPDALSAPGLPHAVGVARDGPSALAEHPTPTAAPGFRADVPAQTLVASVGAEMPIQSATESDGSPAPDRPTFVVAGPLPDAPGPPEGNIDLPVTGLPRVAGAARNGPSLMAEHPTPTATPGFGAEAQPRILASRDWAGPPIQRTIESDAAPAPLPAAPGPPEGTIDLPASGLPHAVGAARDGPVPMAERPTLTATPGFRAHAPMRTLVSSDSAGLPIQLATESDVSPAPGHPVLGAARLLPDAPGPPAGTIDLPATGLPPTARAARDGRSAFAEHHTPTAAPGFRADAPAQTLVASGWAELPIQRATESDVSPAPDRPVFGAARSLPDAPGLSEPTVDPPVAGLARADHAARDRPTRLAEYPAPQETFASRAAVPARGVDSSHRAVSVVQRFAEPPAAPGPRLSAPRLGEARPDRPGPREAPVETPRAAQARRAGVPDRSAGPVHQAFPPLPGTGEAPIDAPAPQLHFITRPPVSARSGLGGSLQVPQLHRPAAAKPESAAPAVFQLLRETGSSPAASPKISPPSVFQRLSGLDVEHSAEADGNGPHSLYDAAGPVAPARLPIARSMHRAGRAMTSLPGPSADGTDVFPSRIVAQPTTAPRRGPALELRRAAAEPLAAGAEALPAARGYDSPTAYDAVVAASADRTPMELLRSAVPDTSEPLQTKVLDQPAATLSGTVPQAVTSVGSELQPIQLRARREGIIASPAGSAGLAARSRVPAPASAPVATGKNHTATVGPAGGIASAIPRIDATEMDTLRPRGPAMAQVAAVEPAGEQPTPARPGPVTPSRDVALPGPGLGAQPEATEASHLVVPPAPEPLSGPQSGPASREADRIQAFDPAWPIDAARDGAGWASQSASSLQMRIDPRFQRSEPDVRAGAVVPMGVSLPPLTSQTQAAAGGDLHPPARGSRGNPASLPVAAETWPTRAQATPAAHAGKTPAGKSPGSKLQSTDHRSNVPRLAPLPAGSANGSPVQLKVALPSGEPDVAGPVSRPMVSIANAEGGLTALFNARRQAAAGAAMPPGEPRFPSEDAPLGATQPATSVRDGARGFAPPLARQADSTVELATPVADVAETFAIPARRDPAASTGAPIGESPLASPLRATQSGETAASDVVRQFAAAHPAASPVRSGAPSAAISSRAVSGGASGSSGTVRAAIADTGQARRDVPPASASSTDAEILPAIPIDRHPPVIFPTSAAEPARVLFGASAETGHPAQVADRRSRTGLAARSPLASTTADAAPAAGSPPIAVGPLQPRSGFAGAPNAPATGLAGRKSPAALAAGPRHTPGAQHSAAAPLAISSASAAKPDASMRTAAIAAYLDRHMPSAASVQPPAQHPWQDRAAFARPARGQAADPPAIRIHIGQIRVDGPPAAPGPRFSRPVPRLGLAAYIERRQGA